MNQEILVSIMQKAVKKLADKIAQLEVDLSLAHGQIEILQEQNKSLVSELEEQKVEVEKEETL